MKHILLSIILSATALGASAQTTQKLTASKINEYGLIYTLPNTAIDITIEAEKTILQPGEFYQYAKKYLGLDPIIEPAETYRLKSVSITPRGVADNAERYLVQFKSGTTPFILLNDADFPLAINTESTSETTMPDLPKSTQPEPTILEAPAANQAITAEMLQSTSSAKRAELAATRIFELRQSRSEIISGSADNMPSDGQAMQLVLDNLAAQEAALTAMFVGTTQTATQVASYTVTPPAAGNLSDSIVARIATQSGIVDADNLAGEPIRVSITATSRGELPKNEKGETKRFPKGGLAYRIPGTANISVTFRGQEVANADIDIAQYGVVFGLEPNLFTDKKAPAYAIFNPLTGAIVELGAMK